MKLDVKNKIAIFYSYAHEDRLLQARLEKHLAILKYLGLISTWYDRNIKAGMPWELEIDSSLNAADIILLLVSADFLASGYCYGIEMKRAIERHERGEARVIPILLRPVDWKGAPFDKLQVLPTNAKPVTSWRQRDDAFVNISRSIRKVAEELYSLRFGWVKPEPIPPNDFGRVYAFREIGDLFHFSDKELRVKSSHSPTFIERAKAFLAKITRHAPSSTLSRSPQNQNEDIPERDEHEWDQIIHDMTSNILDTTKYYLEAEMAYANALTTDPQNAYIYYYYIGNFLKLYSQYEKAYAAYNRSLRLNPSMIDAYFGKGSVLYKLQYYFDAIDTYVRAINLDPDNAFAYYSCSIVFYRLKQYNAALFVYEKAVSLDPHIVDIYQDGEHALEEPKNYRAFLTDPTQLLRGE